MSTENKYVLIFQDDLTKFSQAIPLPSKEANVVAKILLKKFSARLVFQSKFVQMLELNMSILF